MSYSWQFDPLEPNNPVELICDGVVIATTTLKNAQELANKLNSFSDMYEALKDAQHWFAEATAYIPLHSATLGAINQSLAKAGRGEK